MEMRLIRVEKEEGRYIVRLKVGKFPFRTREEAEAFLIRTIFRAPRAL